MAVVLGILILVLSLDGAFAAFDDVFKNVEIDYQVKVEEGLTGRVSQPLWCDYSFPGRRENLIKLQYDMVLDRLRYDSIIEDQFYFVDQESSCETKRLHKRNAVSDTSKLWQTAIPYEIIDFDAEDKVTILKAMQIWSSFTCVNFISSKETDYDKIQFINTDWGCESYVGRMQGPQPVYLASPGCTTVPIILHEIGHVLGLYHEHMRPDRDDYVTVHYENINITNHVQFDPLKNGSTKSYGKAYDYLSVMHYGKNFYAEPSDRLSLEPKDPAFLGKIGEVETLSFLDIKIVNQMYNCAGGCKAKICPENAFMGKDCRCYCKGPARDPIRRCDAVVSCDTPAIDMSVYSVYTANSEEIDSLEGKLYPDGTVLRLFDYMCVDSTVGNFTCVGGVWRIDVTECEHEGCLMDTTRYVFNPSIDDIAILQSKQGDVYARSGVDVSVACKSKPENERVPRRMTCRKRSWDIVLPNCEEVFECEIGDYSNDNIELYLDGEKLEVGKLVHEGSEIKARCKHAHEGLAGSSSLLTCTDGKLVGDFPVDCPNEIYRCPMIPYSAISGPFSEGYLIKCLEKYEKDPTDNRNFFKCGWKGDWQPYEPKCIPEKCAVTYNPATGNVIDTDDDVIPNGTRINSDVSVTLSCLKGHIPDSQQLTCNFGKFKETVNGQLPVCTYVECDHPTLPSTLTYRPMLDKYVYKDEVKMRRCQDNLWFRGDPIITCGANGQWSGKGNCVPFCQPEVGEERLVEYKNKDIIKKWTYGIGSYQGCRDKCNRFKRVLCRAFAFGYIGRNPKCQITFRNPIVSPEILQDQPFWTVWARECDLH
ncbi:uncharacterized protein LOC128224701 [Mya arenaria]|uniref:uncharacterized protein LOC128224701 n=1 Tax=Mya arenaria TaxID=6604 RepID=UPI0022E98FAD|nr:uncharacterized protein LOC128224701 [Mya arenaria]